MQYDSNMSDQLLNKPLVLFFQFMLIGEEIKKILYFQNSLSLTFVLCFISIIAVLHISSKPFVGAVEPSLSDDTRDLLLHVFCLHC